MKVFVYGSLCRNMKNHHYLKNATLTAEQAWTEGELFAGYSYYPLLVKNPSKHTIGEVYEITGDMLSHIDLLEGYEQGDEHSLFVRERVKIDTHQGSEEAYTYFYPHEPKGSPVPHGDWRVHQLLKKDSVYYFAFGSCMDQERMELAGVKPHFQSILGGAVLKGYKLGFTHHVKDGGRADIIEQRGDTVEGVVYQVGQKALNYLYKREGVYSNAYRPIVVQVILKDGRLVPSISFTATVKKEDLTPPLHYAREIHRGGYSYLSKKYIKQLEHRFEHELSVENFSEYLSHYK
ncbi:gamma-glutamylcyclotransferase [Halobacillus yeomjeoni]|uniref:Gamma-glutamylcyclotransferase n=1 Tax=Halobacillus yeomjeoni TaxID=311194 RepID=A0A931HTY1_9BACI|nr:gamma-glutamylcyclotransferase family protein [Halobacillus yeomjeoni]MBH0229494.1 gamma-glutamylcyclotransferase [Halobacillus yeomjeoni]